MAPIVLKTTLPMVLSVRFGRSGDVTQGAEGVSAASLRGRGTESRS